jgi:hypothetical protein
VSSKDSEKIISKIRQNARLFVTKCVTVILGITKSNLCKKIKPQHEKKGGKS